MPKLKLLHCRTPDTPIGQLLKTIRRFLFMPDPKPIYALYGALAGNMIQGGPVWLMFVGGPSSGKTELLNSILEIPHVFEIADISGKAAFLSATNQKDVDKNATGGLLRQIGRHGGFLINDFTSILSLDHRNQMGVLAVFRETYSGRFTRPVGEGGGRSLSWAGRVAFFAGCTNAIDMAQTATAQLGERWLYYRFPYEAEKHYEISRRALQGLTNGHWKQELHATVREFFEECGLHFRMDSESPEALTDKSTMRLIDMASMVARSRSAVTRDTFTKAINGVPEDEREGTSRVAMALAQMYHGMKVIGVGTQERWDTVGRVAIDSMPRMRQIVIVEAWRAKSGAVKVTGLVKMTQSGKGAVDRCIADLVVHGVVEMEMVGGAQWVKLTETARRWLRAWDGLEIW